MTKKTFILGLLFVGLIALAYLYEGPLRKWQNNLGKPKNILAGVKEEKIDKIEITSAGKTVVLEKRGERWKYGGSKDFYADPVLMSGLMAELKIAAGAEVELVSNNQERKSEFKTDASGFGVKIYESGRQTADFVVGGRSGDFNSSYVSTAASAFTYLLKADLTGAFSRPEWRDLAIFSADKNKINKIRFQYPNKEFTVELKDGEWVGTLPRKFSVNQERAGKIAELMADLRAELIPEQNFTGTGLEKHFIIVQASGQGVDNTIMLGQADGDLYYAKRGYSDNIYLIGKEIRDELDKARSLYQ